MVTEDEFYSLLGQRIADLRRAAAMTQQELGDAVGLSRTSITNIENGRQSLQTYMLLLIAKHLRVSMHSLLPHGDSATLLPDNLEDPVRDWLERLLKEEGRK
ncbi:MAG: helix-turn-helix transcriptional regulator [Thermoanaerobaculia bacterium]